MYRSSGLGKARRAPGQAVGKCRQFDNITEAGFVIHAYGQIIYYHIQRFVVVVDPQRIVLIVENQIFYCQLVNRPLGIYQPGSG